MTDLQKIIDSALESGLANQGHNDRSPTIDGDDVVWIDGFVNIPELAGHMAERMTEQLLLENRRYRKALEAIKAWKLPTVVIRGETIPYGSAYGSNGERDYIRKVAGDALAGGES